MRTPKPRFAAAAARRRPFDAIAAVLALLAGPPGAAALPETELDRAVARITAASAFGTVEALAAPGMQGRMSGTEGYRRAAEWVVGEVRRAGLRPAEGLGDYRQAFTHGLAGVESSTLTTFPVEGEKETSPREAVLLEDFAPMVNGGAGDVSAEVVFVGFGFHAPDLGRDDYAGVDVKGKVVLALRGEPEKGDWKDHRPSAARTRAAERMGAAAFLLVDGAVTSTNTSLSRAIPEAMVSEAFADRLLAGQKLTSAELRKVLARGGTASFATGRKVRFVVKGIPWREVTTHNVVAVLPGADPALRGEYVVVGAHLDHVGDWPRLNPGADDNASGSATLLEVARAFASVKGRPRRTVVFVWFAGEEMGLLGARHFVSHPPSGLARCVGVLNLDMLGVGTGLYVAGGDNFPAIRAALEKARDRFAPGFLLKSGLIRGEGRADHAPFFEAGIPAVSLFSSGAEHHGYHSPDDTVYRIAPKAMEAGGRTVFGAAWELADEKP